MIATNSYNEMFINRVNTVKKGYGIGRIDYFVKSDAFANILEQKQNDFPYAGLANNGVLNTMGLCLWEIQRRIQSLWGMSVIHERH